MPRSAKPLVCTMYAYRNKKTGHYHGPAALLSRLADWRNTFADSIKTNERLDVDESKVAVVTLRVRALSEKTKKSPKRTR